MFLLKVHFHTRKSSLFLQELKVSAPIKRPNKTVFFMFLIKMLINSSSETLSLTTFMNKTIYLRKYEQKLKSFQKKERVNPLF